MAGDWIKMRTDLYRDPKVCVIADLLIEEGSELSAYVNQNNQRYMSVTRNVMRNTVVGALVMVWGVLRHRGKRTDDDLIIKNCSVHVIDDVSEIQGFGSAMESVGWVIQDGENLVFPRFFEEFNVEPTGDSRAKNAERQKRFRDKNKQNSNVISNAESNTNSNVTVTLSRNAREEKRREENISSEDKSSSERVLTTDDVFNKKPKTLKPNISNTRDREYLFGVFWSCYPKKVGKGDAEKAFKKINLADMDLITEAILRQCSSHDWRKDNGQFIPNPSTWLNQKRWLDEGVTIEGDGLSDAGRKTAAAAMDFMREDLNNGGSNAG